jgi:hypothetical protein
VVWDRGKQGRNRKRHVGENPTALNHSLPGNGPPTERYLTSLR